MSEACNHAKQAFAWLTGAGFRLTGEHVDAGDNARYDGWRLSYAKGLLTRIVVRIEYGEMELSVILKKGGVETTYLFLDHHLFGGASGFKGGMFPPEKLTEAVTRISHDMASNYKEIFSGDRELWGRISQLVGQEGRRRQREEKEFWRRLEHKFERLEAADAFRARDYARVVELLSPIAEHLDSLELKKLEYARKKM
jgi:hypothetical protein